MSTKVKEPAKTEDVVVATLDAIVAHPGKLMAIIESVTSGKRFDSISICAHFLTEQLRNEGRSFQVSAEAVHRRTSIVNAINYVDDQIRALYVLQSVFGQFGFLPYEPEAKKVSVVKVKKGSDVVMDTIDTITGHPAKLMETIRELSPNAHFQNVEHTAHQLISVLMHPGQTHVSPQEAGVYNTRINSAMMQLNDQKDALLSLQQAV